MPGATLPPSHARQVGGAIARVERIERRTTNPANSDAVRMIFSYPGALANNIESPPWYVPRSGQIEIVRVSLTNAASANHTVSVRVNGVEQQQFTLGTGSLTTQFSASIGVALAQYVTVETISVADSNLAVEIRLG